MVRWCETCRHVKPDRAHHCSVCGKCVLKMDHHCPWVNNCICFTTYKYFLLFLSYSLLFSFYVVLTTLEYFVSFWQNYSEGPKKCHILFLFFVAIMFALSLLSLYGYHIHLVINNRTTLETFRAPIFRTGPDKHGFDRGFSNNLKDVFGDDPKKWFLPIGSTPGNGYSFPLRQSTEETERLLI